MHKSVGDMLQVCITSLNGEGIRGVCIVFGIRRAGCHLHGSGHEINVLDLFDLNHTWQ